MFVGGNQRWMSRTASRAGARRAQSIFAPPERKSDKRADSASMIGLSNDKKKVEVVISRRKLPKKSN